MTLGIIWLREKGNTRELLVASDSRLSGGQYWDGNPKIMLLPRTDVVISFAGNTAYAYPLMIQAYNAIGLYNPAINRALDLAKLKGHLIRIFNHTQTFISGLPIGQNNPDEPDAIFALSGYDWRSKEFRIWTLHFDKSIERFTFRPATKWGGQEVGTKKYLTYLGDEEAILIARDKLTSLLKNKGKLTGGSFDMEPFEVLRDIIRSEAIPSVGGPIQLVKIYEHSNAAPIGVKWPDAKSGNIAVLGRPLLHYEQCPWGVLDPDNPDCARKI